MLISEHFVRLVGMATASTDAFVDKCFNCAKESPEKWRFPTCDHFLCKESLLSCTNESGERNVSKDKLKCPSCSDRNERPDSWMDNFDGSDSAYTDKSCSNQELCISCKNLVSSEKAVKFCRNCVDSFCQKCLKICHSVEAFKHHEFVTIDATLESVKEILLLCKMSSFAQCPSHSNRTIKFHCLDHDTICCSYCAFVECRKCKKVEEIAKLVGYGKEIHNMKVRTSHALKLADETIDKLKCCAEKQREKESSLTEYTCEVRGKINTMFDGLERECNKTVGDLTTKERWRIDNEIRRLKQRSKL